jgi:hypothetical protein
MAKKIKLPEKIDGPYSAIPHVILDSVAFKGASDKAKALLFPIVRQLNGQNNGRIQLTQPWLTKQGFPSSSNYKARDELITRGLLFQTKYGGLKMGPNWYAVTWLPITNFVGLDIQRFDRGAWALCKLERTNKRKPPKQKREERYDYRSISATNIVAIDKLLATNIVAKNDQTQINQATTIVNNVVNTNTLIKFRRIVGKKGRSGKIKYIPFANKLKGAMYG